MSLKLYNSLTRSEETFTPIDPQHVRMYVCGPTVYDSPHIGNARSVVVYDVMYRLLQHLYPKVTYARNITDVDDKINTAAKERGVSIQALTTEVTAKFHADMDALNCLRPTIEPRATTHIPEMIAMIESLIAKGHAYAAEGHVLFSVSSDDDYGKLARRSLDDMVAGARVEIAPYKKDPMDFVLWKPASPHDDASSIFESPWSKGRPGWHIECSAMSTKHLGATFDLHGGGADLMFPHHENEIAQSECATGHAFAKYWVHNGFLTVNGEKMSKSLGNFITVRDLLDKGVKGEVIRYALLSTHYRKPLDWTDKLLEDAKKRLDYFYRKMLETSQVIAQEPKIDEGAFFSLLKNDLNVPGALAELDQQGPMYLRQLGEVLGILQQSPSDWFKGVEPGMRRDDSGVEAQIAARAAAKKAKNWAEADRIRNELKDQGILLEDRPDGTTDWKRA